MDSLVVDTALGIIFIFGTFALLISVVTELIARFIGLRGEYLLRGIRSLVDEKNEFKLPAPVILRLRKPAVPGREPTSNTAKILTTSYVANTGGSGALPANAGEAELSNKDRRSLPSYLSGRTFARAVVDLIVPDPDRSATTIDAVRAQIGGLGDGALKTYLMSLTRSAQVDIDGWRAEIEHWYDDEMARVSGWYKRHVRWISLGVGVLFVLVFNLNCLQFAKSLYTDQALRASVVSAATSASNCGSKDPADCLKSVEAQIGTARGAGLPIGWGRVPACVGVPRPCGVLATEGLADPDPAAGPWSQIWFGVLIVAGWALMLLSLLPGARFWFDLLGRFGTLRSTGPKPGTT
jgi:hypothetical protein